MAALSAKNEQLQSKVDTLSCQLDLANATAQQYKLIADTVGDLQLQLKDSKQTIAAQRSKLKENKATLKGRKQEIKDLNKLLQSQQRQSTKPMLHSPATADLIDSDLLTDSSRSS